MIVNLNSVLFGWEQFRKAFRIFVELPVWFCFRKYFRFCRYIFCIAIFLSVTVLLLGADFPNIFDSGIWTRNKNNFRSNSNTNLDSFNLSTEFNKSGKIPLKILFYVIILFIYFLKTKAMSILSLHHFFDD